MLWFQTQNRLYFYGREKTFYDIIINPFTFDAKHNGYCDKNQKLFDVFIIAYD